MIRGNNVAWKGLTLRTFVPELPKTYLSGAARWLSKDKALIMLSLRHKSDDHLWFTFFHEAGHILLHSKKEVFIDDKKFGEEGIEEQANSFSRNMLNPQKEYRNFAMSGRWSAAPTYVTKYTHARDG